jgi:UDP-N-acetylglucosamine 2-epimerase (non-hydrolysing)
VDDSEQNLITLCSACHASVHHGVPCLTLGSNTERPVTVDMGTNVLIGQDPGLLDSELTKILEGGAKKGSIPPLWDGRASERIVQALREYLAA